MTWTDPEAAKTSFETNDILTQPNIYTVLMDNLLSLPHVIDNTPADLTVSGTTSETTFYSVTIPANSLGSNGTARMMTFGDITGTTGAGGGGSCTFRAKFGGSTITSFVGDYVNNTVAAGLLIDLIVTNQGATNAQVVTFGISEVGPDAGGPTSLAYPVPVTAAIDTTVNQTLVVTAQWTTVGTNSARRLDAHTYIARN